MPGATGEVTLSAAWSEALELFDRDLAVRSAAEATRQAYIERRRAARDLGGDSMTWRPPRSTTATCAASRRCSRSGASRRPAWPASSPRSAPSTARWCGAAGPRRTRPTWSRPRSRTASSLASSAARRCRLCSMESRPRTPLEMRDRAMLELAYSCGLRAEEVVNLNTDSPDFDGERLRIEGKGGKTRLVPMGEPAQAALTRYLERGRRALVGAGDRGCAARLEERAAAPSVGRAAAPAALGARGRDRGRRLAPRPAPLVRDAPAGGRRGSAEHPGAPRTRESLDDAGLHPS